MSAPHYELKKLTIKEETLKEKHLNSISIQRLSNPLTQTLY